VRYIKEYFLNLTMNKGLAEVYGAMLGDGCLSTYYSKDKQKQEFCTLITGHTHDRAYYERIIRPVFIKEFGTKGYLRARTERNAILMVTLKKSVFDFFIKFGFKPGKKEYINIPEIILEDKILSRACVRGIFDTDGSIYRRYSKKYNRHKRVYKHLVIQFKMNSEILMEQIKKVLESNGIKTTRITAERRSFVLRITEQKSVHLFMKVFRPNNPYHTERYLNNS
jgi:hypothetical protein